jgi:hypothetical protein
VTEDRLLEFLAESDVGINLHNEDYPTFENRVIVYLAAGLLVVTEPLSPWHGLRPGVDLLVCRDRDELLGLFAAIERTPDAFRAMRLAGRTQAERFRASRVYPAFVRELEDDVRRFGRGRSLPSAS